MGIVTLVDETGQVEGNKEGGQKSVSYEKAVKAFTRNISLALMLAIDDNKTILLRKARQSRSIIRLILGTAGENGSSTPATKLECLIENANALCFKLLACPCRQQRKWYKN